MKTVKSTFLILSFVALSISGCKSMAPSATAVCEENRVAWDFGSGSFKVKAARVNVCELRISETLYEESRKMNLKDDIETRPDRSFSAESLRAAKDFVREQSVKLKSLNIEAEATGQIKQMAVATSAFRDSTNAEQLIEELNQEFKINARIIPQKEEGEWGYKAAQVRKPKGSNEMPVWDIGGGSQQFIQKLNGELRVQESRWASVSFQKLVLEKIQKVKATEKKSPNPMKRADISAALKEARKLGAEWKTAGTYPKPGPKEVIGIGGVLSSSLANRTGKEDYTAKDLDIALLKLVGKTDSQLNSPYAGTEVTNVIFVLGLMKELGIDQVHSVKANLTDGVLAYGAY